MKPEFMINDRGYVFCKCHPQYQNMVKAVKEIRSIQDPFLRATKIQENRRILRQVRTCEACDHYIQDNCYFSQREIKLIKLKRKLNLYRCKFCGSAVSYVNNILYKKLAEQEFNVKMPQMCCFCYISLRSTNIKKEFKSQFRHYLAACMGFLLMALIPGIPIFLPSVRSYEDILLMVTFAIPIFSIFFSVAIIEFIKILKLKYSLKRSAIFKNLLNKEHLDEF